MVVHSYFTASSTSSVKGGEYLIVQWAERYLPVGFLVYTHDALPLSCGVDMSVEKDELLELEQELTSFKKQAIEDHFQGYAKTKKAAFWILMGYALILLFLFLIRSPTDVFPPVSYLLIAGISIWGGIFSIRHALPEVPPSILDIDKFDDITPSNSAELQIAALRKRLHDLKFQRTRDHYLEEKGKWECYVFFCSILGILLPCIVVILCIEQCNLLIIIGMILMALATWWATIWVYRRKPRKLQFDS
jgi:hypothetical protein